MTDAIVPHFRDPGHADPIAEELIAQLQGEIMRLTVRVIALEGENATLKANQPLAGVRLRPGAPDYVTWVAPLPYAPGPSDLSYPGRAYPPAYGPAFTAVTLDATPGLPEG